MSVSIEKHIHADGKGVCASVCVRVCIRVRALISHVRAQLHVWCLEQTERQSVRQLLHTTHGYFAHAMLYMCACAVRACAPVRSQLYATVRIKSSACHHTSRRSHAAGTNGGCVTSFWVAVRAPKDNATAQHATHHNTHTFYNIIITL